MTLRLTTMSVFVAAAVIVLAGCTGPGPVDPPPVDPTPTTDPQPTATADPSGAPAARFDGECDSLMPTDLLTRIFAEPMAPHSFPETEFAAIQWIPYSAAVTQVGGLLCEWSNGQPYSAEVGASAFRGIQIAIIPDADAVWQSLVDASGMDPVIGQADCNGAGCFINQFSNGYWLSAEIDEDNVHLKSDAIEAFKANFKQVAATWGAPTEAPHPQVPIAADCAALLPESLVLELLPGDSPLPQTDTDFPYITYREAARRNGDLSCWWMTTMGTVRLQTLTGGAWLADSLGATDGCDQYTCWTDLRIDGNWIRVIVEGDDIDRPAIAAQFLDHARSVVEG